MGHLCKICETIKPNEKFSGKGHKNHVCKKCAAKPKTAIIEAEQEDEVFGFLTQSHISAKNIKRLQRLAASENEEVAKLAHIVLEVAKVAPYKKRRLKVLAKERRVLLEQLEETGLIFAHHS